MTASIPKKVYLYLDAGHGFSREVSLPEKTDMDEVTNLYYQIVEALGDKIQDHEKDRARLSLGLRAVHVQRDGVTVRIDLPKDDAKIEELLGRMKPLVRKLTDTEFGAMKIAPSSRRTGFITGGSIAHQFAEFNTPGKFLRQFGSYLLAKLDPTKWAEFLRRLIYMDKFYASFKELLATKIKEEKAARDPLAEESSYEQQLQVLLETLEQKEHIDLFALYFASAFEDGKQVKKFLEEQMLLEKQGQESILWSLIGRWSTEIDKEDTTYIKSVEELFNDKPNTITLLDGTKIPQTTLNQELLWKKRDGLGADNRADFRSIFPSFAFHPDEDKALPKVFSRLEQEADAKTTEAIDTWDISVWDPDPSKLKSAKVSDLKDLAESGRQQWIEQNYLRKAISYIDSFGEKEE